MAERTLISLLSPCFNEADNIDELYRRVSAVMDGLPQYDFEYLLIDNASTDGVPRTGDFCRLAATPPLSLLLTCRIRSN